MFMKRTADRLFGTDYLWSVLAAGRFQMPFATQAALLGGSVRVGLEDSLYISKGKLASSNAEQVSKIRTILQELGYIPRKKLMQNELWDRVKANLKSQGVSILVIDEMQKIKAQRGHETRQVSYYYQY